VRGFAGVHLLIIVEAARVPDDLYRALRPMVATSEGADLLSVHAARGAGGVNVAYGTNPNQFPAPQPLLALPRRPVPVCNFCVSFVPFVPKLVCVCEWEERTSSCIARY
jgi:hypothetical protein